MQGYSPHDKSSPSNFVQSQFNDIQLSFSLGLVPIKEIGTGVDTVWTYKVQKSSEYTYSNSCYEQKAELNLHKKIVTQIQFRIRPLCK